MTAVTVTPKTRHDLHIVSGGQTGVDRGALDAALESGVQCGGWCPQGRMAEDGPISNRYPLTELDGGYSERTRRNVEDSDGTLILHCGALSEGTLYTLELCKELKKPVCLVDGNETDAAAAAAIVLTFVAEHDIHKLNVAGPRASKWPEARDFAREVIRQVLADFATRTVATR
jgi:predicted Rossmann-fold nucleotide-binding protein